MLENLKNKKEILILITIMIVSSMWLITKGMPYAHDIEFHYDRLKGLTNTLATGDFLALIHNTFYGYGYATGLFYNNFYLYIPAFLSLMGLSYMTSFKILYVLINILTTLSIFWCLKTISKNNKISILGTILYMFSNYRMVDVYPRGAMGEILAFMIIPIIILGLYHIIYGDYKKWYLFTIGFVLLLLAHLITTFLLAIFVFIFLVLNYKKLITEKQRIKYLLISGLVGVLLGLFFLAPMLEQKLYGNINIFEGESFFLPNDYAVSIKNFLIMTDFFNQYLGFSLVLLLPIRYFIKKSEVKNKELLTCADYLFILGIIAWVSTTKIFPWNIVGKSLGFIQFPWRLLIVATSFLTVAYSIYISFITKEKIKKYIYFVIVICSCLEVALYSLQYGIRKNQYNSFPDNVIGTGEYLLYKTDVEDFEKQDHQIKSNNHNLVIKYDKTGTKVDIEYSNNKDDNTYIEIPLFNYLGYTVEGAKLENGNNNVIRLLLNKEHGKISVRYSGTKVQEISYLISSITLVGLVVYILIEKREK